MFRGMTCLVQIVYVARTPLDCGLRRGREMNLSGIVTVDCSPLNQFLTDVEGTGSIKLTTAFSVKPRKGVLLSLALRKSVFLLFF